MRLYGLKNCDTCRNALKALPHAEFVDVRAAGVPDEVLSAALSEFETALVNTRSTTWRGLDAQAQALPAHELIKEHPTLMKRPLIVQGEQMYLGWTVETQQALGVS